MTNISSLTSPFILATVPRSGTHWLANMLISSGLDGVTRSNPNLSYDNILKEIRTDSWKKLRAGVFLYDHIRYNGIADLVTQSEVKSLVLYRDPRDKLVSNYYYTKYIFKKHNRSFSESFDELVPIILNQYNDIAVAWLNYKNTLPLRYEDLVGNTADELSRIFELIGHKSKMDVNIIAEKYSVLV
jgi:hypothetical protein